MYDGENFQKFACFFWGCERFLNELWSQFISDSLMSTLRQWIENWNSQKPNFHNIQYIFNASGFVLGSLKYNEVETAIAINNYCNVTSVYFSSVRAYCTSSSVFVSFGSLQRRWKKNFKNSIYSWLERKWCINLLLLEMRGYQQPVLTLAP